MAQKLGDWQMNSSKFPVSRRLQGIPGPLLSKTLAAAYAFYAHSRKRAEYVRNDHEVKARIFGGFPVWYTSGDLVNAQPGSSFTRTVAGKDYYFYRSNSEFVAVEFCVLDDPKPSGSSAVFCQLEYNEKNNHKLLSTFIVSTELFTRIQLFLAELGDHGAFPRIIVIAGTGQCGLLVTTNHRTSRLPREHVIFPLPELSFGRANRRGDDFRDLKISLEQFILSSQYPMGITSVKDAW